MNVVSIAAHQDDEMRCLGTMLKCKARGDDLHFITVTDGSKGFVQQPDIDPDEAASIRQAEMGRLADEVGATNINLRFPDEFLFDSAEVRMKLIEAIRSTKSELVFTHFSEDYNQDHVTVNGLVRHCAMQAALPVLPTRSAPLTTVPAIFLTLPFGPVDFVPSHFVEISDYEVEKIRLLSYHKSQERAMSQAVGVGFAALCERPDAYWGDQAG